MTSPGAGSVGSASDAEAMQQMLAGLGADPARVQDSMRLTYLRALARRIDTAPPAVQSALAGKLEKALAGFAPQPSGDGIASSTGGDGSTAGFTARKVEPSQLVQLTQRLKRARPLDNAGQGPARDESAAELRSVRGFSEVWSKIAAENQLEQALARKPANAGPLNSQMLVLRTLALMRDLSPDYLRRFMAQVDALAWLEQAGVRAKPVAAKARTGQRKG